MTGLSARMVLETTGTRNTEAPGALELLLIVAEKKRVVVRPPERQSGLEDFTSHASLRECCRNLTLLGLAVEEIETGPRPRTWLVITETGKKVAEIMMKTRTLSRPETQGQ